MQSKHDENRKHDINYVGFLFYVFPKILICSPNFDCKNLMRNDPKMKALYLKSVMDYTGCNTVVEGGLVAGNLASIFHWLTSLYSSVDYTTEQNVDIYFFYVNIQY